MPTNTKPRPQEPNPPDKKIDIDDAQIEEPKDDAFQNPPGPVPPANNEQTK